MTDDRTPDPTGGPTGDPTDWASAYLDGEATDEEVARVRGDAELLAEVERLRLVRALVRDVEPAPVSARERQLAGALDAWDRLPAGERDGSHRERSGAGLDPVAAAAAASITAPSTSRRRRGVRSNGWIVAAAASLVVVLAGGLTLRSLRRDDDGSDAGTAAVETTIGEAPAAPQAGDTAEQPLEAQSAPAAADAGAGLSTDPSIEPSPDIADPDTGAAEPDAAPPPDDSLEDLTTPEQVGDYASAAIDENGDLVTTVPAPTEQTVATDEATTTAAAEQARTAEAAAPFPLCGGADLVVGPAMYKGVDVVVAIDSDRRRALAYVPETCSVLASVPLP